MDLLQDVKKKDMNFSICHEYLFWYLYVSVSPNLKDVKPTKRYLDHDVYTSKILKDVFYDITDNGVALYRYYNEPILLPTLVKGRLWKLWIDQCFTYIQYLKIGGLKGLKQHTKS